MFPKNALEILDYNTLPVAQGSIPSFEKFSVPSYPRNFGWLIYLQGQDVCMLSVQAVS